MNMKKVTYFFAAGISALFFGLASCAKDEVVNDEVSLEIVKGNDRTSNLSKSFLYEPEDIEFDVIRDYPYGTKGNEYRVMKVKRQADTTKYFWIMIDNFRYKTKTGSFVYNNDESNAEIYGRFYHWETANECGNKIQMKLPRRNKDGSYTKKKYPTFGHLPTIQDFKDLLETDVIGAHPWDGVQIYDDFDYGYYDFFLSGEEYFESAEPELAYHTMAGFRDNSDSHNSPFDDIHNEVYFWTSERSGSSDCHYPLDIMFNDGAYSAFINAGHANHYGFSVRYVFEPKQL